VTLSLLIIYAKKFGVTEFVNPKDHETPVQKVIAEMTNGGMDRSIEYTGSITAMISAFEWLGITVLVGAPNKDDAFKTHPINLLNERTLKGTFFGNYKPRSDILAVVEKYMKGSYRSTRRSNSCLKEKVFDVSFTWTNKN
ncbi:hypothetical protein GIB67_024453, partial [Kingdonia uniflora]